MHSKYCHSLRKFSRLQPVLKAIIRNIVLKFTYILSIQTEKITHKVGFIAFLWQLTDVNRVSIYFFCDKSLF